MTCYAPSDKPAGPLPQGTLSLGGATRVDLDNPGAGLRMSLAPKAVVSKGATHWQRAAGSRAAPLIPVRLLPFMLIRISAPHFVAGLVVGERAADIIGYMRSWSADRVCAYCRGKRWMCEVVD